MSRVINEKGNRYGKLTVISRAENSPGGKARWTCLCDCGDKVTVLGYDLRKGNTTSCGKHRYTDEKGNRYGKLTVTDRAENSPGGQAQWRCKCDCGNETIVRGCDLRNGVKSCPSHKYIDEEGNRYGKLTVVERAENSPRRKAQWTCLCDCGNNITVLGYDLRKGNVTSCGCCWIEF
jgi:hypothetical protein